MPENREALLVMHRMKVPVASPDGVRQVIRELQPGEFLSRADWDRFPARSKRSMINTGFVKDPLNVQINSATGQADVGPPPRPSVTRVNSYEVERIHPVTGAVYRKRIEGRDRKVQTAVRVIPEPEYIVPTPKRRGRPKGSKNRAKG